MERRPGATASDTFWEMQRLAAEAMALERNGRLDPDARAGLDRRMRALRERHARQVQQETGAARALLARSGVAAGGRPAWPLRRQILVIATFLGLVAGALLNIELGGRLVPSAAYRTYQGYGWRAFMVLVPLCWVLIAAASTNAAAFRTTPRLWARFLFVEPASAVLVAGMLASAPFGWTMAVVWATGDERTGVEATLLSVDPYRRHAKGCDQYVALEVESARINFCAGGPLEGPQWRPGAKVRASGKASRLGFLVQHIEPAAAR